MAVSRKFFAVSVLGVASFALIGAGAGATFSGGGTADANIDTGTFSCQLSSTPGSNVVISADKHTATVNLGTINSSAASSKKVPVTVTNTGSIPLATSWNETTTGNLLGAFSEIPAAAGVPLGAGDTQTVDIGFKWTELSNSDLNRAGTAQYTVNCNETPSTQIVRSSPLNYSGTGWGGWSCPAGTKIVSATAENSTGGVQMAELVLWRPGASVGSFTFPTTPFGYSYVTGEEGAIAQNNGATAPITLVLTCTK